MKRFLIAAVVCGLMTLPAMAQTPPWGIGADQSTHVFWNFLSGDLQAGQPPFTFDPTLQQAFGSGIHDGTDAALITGFGLNYNSGEGKFTSTYPIDVDLKLYNFLNLNQFKEVLVAVDTNGAVGNAALVALDHNVSFTVAPLGVLPPGYDLGWIVEPNPFQEEISFTVYPQIDENDGFTASSVPSVLCLDSITVDTICVPAPGAWLLAGLGASLVGWLRRRHYV